MTIQSNTYLSIGTNQGNKLDNLQNAINLIDDRIGAIEKRRQDFLYFLLTLILFCLMIFSTKE